MDSRTYYYARVSSKKKEDDLNRQIEYLKQYMSNKYQTFEIIFDVGYGINYNKKGLQPLIEKINKKIPKNSWFPEKAAVFV